MLRQAVKRAVRGRLEGVFARPPLSRLLCWRGRPDSGRLAVTFDDGPDPRYTEEVLAILAAADAQASFFLLGRQIEQYPALVERIVAAGHEVGVHGWDHTRRDLPAQARRTEEALAGLGVTTRLFRPPGGYLEARTLLWMVRHGWTTVMWSFDTIDSMRHEGKRSGPVPYDRLRAGDIVLMHDDNPVCPADLEHMLTIAADKGLRAVVASEVMR